jgi:hypothetical protein
MAPRATPKRSRNCSGELERKKKGPGAVSALDHLPESRREEAGAVRSGSMVVEDGSPPEADVKLMRRLRQFLNASQ